MNIFLPRIPFCRSARLLRGLLSLLLLFALAGCQPAPAETPPEQPLPPSFPVTFSVEADSFTVSKKPTKLVSLSPDLTEGLDDIGAAGLLAGVSDYCPEITGISAKTTCGTPLNPNLEALESLSPDLILTAVPLLEEHQQALDALGIPVILLPRPSSISGTQERSRALHLLCYGETAGTEQATQFNDLFQAKLNAIFEPATAYADLSGRKSVIYLAYLDLTLATGDTYEGKLLEEMGMDNLAASGIEWQFPEEKAQTLLPELIFYDSTLDPNQILQSEQYAESPAVQKNQLIPIDFGAVQRENLAMLDQLSAMVSACYPGVL